MKSSYLRNSAMDDSDSNAKGMPQQPAGNSLAVRESQITAAVSFNPRCQQCSRASRKTKLSGWNPAAVNTARATFRNSGQREATPTSFPAGAGNQRASEAGTEQICKRSSSV